MFPTSCKGSFTAGVIFHSARPHDFAGLKLFCGAPPPPWGVLDTLRLCSGLKGPLLVVGSDEARRLNRDY